MPRVLPSTDYRALANLRPCYLGLCHLGPCPVLPGDVPPWGHATWGCGPLEAVSPEAVLEPFLQALLARPWYLSVSHLVWHHHLCPGLQKDEEDVLLGCVKEVLKRWLDSHVNVVLLFLLQPNVQSGWRSNVSGEKILKEERVGQRGCCEKPRELANSLAKMTDLNLTQTGFVRKDALLSVFHCRLAARCFRQITASLCYRRNPACWARALPLTCAWTQL